MTPTGLEETSNSLEISPLIPKSDAKSDAELETMLTEALSEDSFCQFLSMWCMLSPRQKEKVLSTTTEIVADRDVFGATSTKPKL